MCSRIQTTRAFMYFHMNEHDIIYSFLDSTVTLSVSVSYKVSSVMFRRCAVDIPPTMPSVARHGLMRECMHFH